MSQRSFASAEYALKKKSTGREQFLAEMERIVPWGRLDAAIAPSYPRSGRVCCRRPNSDQRGGLLVALDHLPARSAGAL